MDDKIRGKVAQILTSRELVINRGSGHGVEIGMQFAVLNERGADIVDPDTGESLGSIDVPKVLVKIVRISEKLAVASTFRKFETAAGPLAGFSAFANLSRPSEIYVETLRTDESTYNEELDPEDSFVHIADPVVQVTGDEFSGWDYRNR